MSEQQQAVFSPKQHTAKGAQRIHRLIVVAAELFLERGFEGVVVDDLIARVGGSRSNIYSHFGGKEGLFKAAMLHLCAEVAGPMERLRVEGRTAAEALHAFGQVLIQTGLSPHTLALHRLLSSEGRRFPELAQAMWRASYYKVVEILAQWIARQQGAAGAAFVSTVPAQALAEQFISLVTSDVKLRVIVGLVQLPLPQDQAEQIVSRAVQTFLQGALATLSGGKTP